MSSSRGKTYRLWVRKDNLARSGADFYVNLDLVKDVREGDVVELYQHQPDSAADTTGTAGSNPGGSGGSGAGGTGGGVDVGGNGPGSGGALIGGGGGGDGAGGGGDGSNNNCYVLQLVHAMPETERARGGELSVSSQLAEVFRLQNLRDIYVRRVPSRDAVTLEVVEVVFRGQYIGRNDMWRVTTSLSGTCVYQSQEISHGGVRARATDLWLPGGRVSSGFVGPETKFVFRSHSAQVHLMIQMSSEMLRFDWSGNQYIEKVVLFVEEMLAKWEESGCAHELTLVLFARTFYGRPQVVDAIAVSEERNGKKQATTAAAAAVAAAAAATSIVEPPLQRLPDGTVYEDWYEVVCHTEARPDSTGVVAALKARLDGFTDRAQRKGGVPGCEISAGRPSTAAEGNVLEAINMALNRYDRHYIDRSNTRTGLSVLVVSPGCGVLDVPRSQLADTTRQRVIDCGCACDVVCLSEPPLHATPLLRLPAACTLSAAAASSSSLNWEYIIPHWMHQTFYDAPGLPLLDSRARKVDIHGTLPARYLNVAPLPAIVVPPVPPCEFQPVITEDRRVEDVLNDYEEHDLAVWTSMQPRLAEAAAAAAPARTSRRGSIVLPMTPPRTIIRSAPSSPTRGMSISVSPDWGHAEAIVNMMAFRPVRSGRHRRRRRTVSEGPQIRDGGGGRFWGAQLEETGEVSGSEEADNGRSGSGSSYRNRDHMAADNGMQHQLLSSSVSSEVAILTHEQTSGGDDRGDYSSSRQPISFVGGYDRRKRSDHNFGERRLSRSLEADGGSPLLRPLSTSVGSGGSGDSANGNGSRNRNTNVQNILASGGGRSRGGGHDPLGRPRANARASSLVASLPRLGTSGNGNGGMSLSTAHAPPPKSFRPGLATSSLSPTRPASRSASPGTASNNSEGIAEVGGVSGEGGSNLMAGLNPFKAPLHSSWTGDQRRWAHAFPSAVLNSTQPFGPVWRSVCQPACIPLTTDFLPSEIDLLRTHSVSSVYPVIFVDHWDGRRCTELGQDLSRRLFVLLKAQRLSQGFQLCVTPADTVGEGIEGTEGSSAGGGGGPGGVGIAVGGKLVASSAGSATSTIGGTATGTTTMANAGGGSVAGAAAAATAAAAAAAAATGVGVDVGGGSGSSSIGLPGQRPTSATALSDLLASARMTASSSALMQLSRQQHIPRHTSQMEPTARAGATQWMSFGNHYHKLSFDPVQNRIDVSVFRPKAYSPRVSTGRYYYNLLVPGATGAISGAGLPQQQHSTNSAMTTDTLATAATIASITACPRSCTFTPSALDGYGWNFADTLLASALDVDEPMSMAVVESLKFWRVRFALVPMDTGGGAWSREALGEAFGEVRPRFDAFIEDLNRILQMNRESRVADETDGAAGDDKVSPISLGRVQSRGRTHGPIPTDRFMVSTLSKFVEDDQAVLAHRIAMDVDPKRVSGRDEWALVYYDAECTPGRAWHIEMQWLVATAALCFEQVERWRKRAEARRFRLVPVPIQPQGLSEDTPHADPLVQPLRLNVAVPPVAHTVLTASPRMRARFLERILRAHDFVLDAAGPPLPKDAEARVSGDGDTRGSSGVGGGGGGGGAGKGGAGSSSIGRGDGGRGGAGSRSRPPAGDPYATLGSAFSKRQFVHVSGEATVLLLIDDMAMLWSKNSLLQRTTTAAGSRLRRFASRSVGGGSSGGAGGEAEAPVLDQLAALCANMPELTRLWRQVATEAGSAPRLEGPNALAEAAAEAAAAAAAAATVVVQDRAIRGSNVSRVQLATSPIGQLSPGSKADTADRGHMLLRQQATATDSAAASAASIIETRSDSDLVTKDNNGYAPGSRQSGSFKGPTDQM
eukprot:UC1_evm3s517